MTIEFDLSPEYHKCLQVLCGPCDAHLKLLETHYPVVIYQRAFHFQIVGQHADAFKVTTLLTALYAKITQDSTLTEAVIYRKIKEHDLLNPLMKTIHPNRKHSPQPSGSNQARYLQHIEQHPITFAIGPAGTGKTYLAVAKAVSALDADDFERLIFVRPAVEAGEKLGFLPGDLGEKVLPYLRPIYDALDNILGVDKVKKLLAENVIEIAPIAYMRGRTLDNAFIILDEAQNTTIEQMKMFLTRIGFGSKAVITGDLTQIDLNQTITSGLSHAIQLLKDLEGINVSYFQAKDCVRHPLVQKIILAYENNT